MGDSGGPVFVTDKTGPPFYIVGIISFGSDSRHSVLLTHTAKK